MTSSSVEWLDKSLELLIFNGFIECFDYVDFDDFKKIGDSRLDNIRKAEWKDCRITVVLKSLNAKAFNADIESEANSTQEFVKTLRILHKVRFHPNIIRFYGITKDPVNGYNLIFNYANNGNLREYLSKNVSKLIWTDKLRIAEEIARGLAFLHKKDFVHRNLHIKSILVHNGRMLIADFDYFSKSANSCVNVYEMPAFMEPRCLNDSSYELDKKSDIYSLGVIFWEISSCKIPFKSVRRIDTIFSILRGERESPIENTPPEYIELYKLCWDKDPENRPDATHVLELIEHLGKNKEVKTQLQLNKDYNLPGQMESNLVRKADLGTHYQPDIATYKCEKKILEWHLKIAEGDNYITQICDEIQSFDRFLKFAEDDNSYEQNNLETYHKYGITNIKY